MVVAAVSFPMSRVRDVTFELADLKKQFHPLWKRDCPKPFDWMLRELKGADIRKQVAEGGRRQWRPALGKLGKVIDVIKRNDGAIFGCVYVLQPGHVNNATAMYTKAIQRICAIYERHLAALSDEGIMIIDSRRHKENVNAAHSILTRQLKKGGPGYRRLQEVPLFAHSDNHAGLQIADLVASGIIFPLAMDAYCKGKISNIHVRPEYSRIRSRLATRVREIAYQSQRCPHGFHVQNRYEDRHSDAGEQLLLADASTSEAVEVAE